ATRVDVHDGRAAGADAVLDRGTDPWPEGVGEDARDEEQVQLFGARSGPLQQPLHRQGSEIFGEVVWRGEAAFQHTAVEWAVLADKIGANRHYPLRHEAGDIHDLRARH